MRHLWVMTRGKDNWCNALRAQQAPQQTAVVPAIDNQALQTPLPPPALDGHQGMFQQPLFRGRSTFYQIAQRHLFRAFTAFSGGCRCLAFFGHDADSIQTIFPPRQSLPSLQRALEYLVQPPIPCNELVIGTTARKYILRSVRPILCWSTWSRGCLQTEPTGYPMTPTFGLRWEGQSLFADLFPLAIHQPSPYYNDYFLVGSNLRKTEGAVYGA